jgi:hypothetical protein
MPHWVRGEDERTEHDGVGRRGSARGDPLGHLRQHARATKVESELIQRTWAMHIGDGRPAVHHYIRSKRNMRAF